MKSAIVGLQSRLATYNTIRRRDAGMVPTQLGQFHAATHVASIVLGTRLPNGCRLPCREAVVKKKKMVEVCSDGVRMGSDGFG